MSDELYYMEDIKVVVLTLGLKLRTVRVEILMTTIL